MIADVLAESALSTYAQPLVVPVSVRPGEGLPDLLWRAAAENCYPTTHSVLKAAGLEGRYAAGIASRGIGHEDALAVTLGVPGGADDIRRLLYYPDPVRKGWHDFFGTRIRLAHREVLRRRVSPRALRDSLHSKAIWSIKVFSFDPGTKEQLLEKCPSCGRYFGFGDTLGVACCPSCVRLDHEGFSRGRVDVRDFLQPLVSVDDEEALDFVTGLIDPDPEVRRTFRPKLHDCLQGYERGELFEFVIALSCALTAEPEKTTSFLPRPASRAEYSRFTPGVLSVAGRVVLDWPAGFHKIAERIREKSDQRPGHFGIKKELGPLLALRLDPHIQPGLRELARQALEGDMALTSTGLTMVRRKENLFRNDLLTVERAAKKFGVTRRTLARIVKDPRSNAQRAGTAEKAPLLLSEGAFVQILSMRDNFISDATAAKLLGFPILALRPLASRGLLELCQDPLGLPPGDYVERLSLDSLVEKVQTPSLVDRAPTSALSLAEVAGLVGAPFRNPWASLVPAIIEARIRTWLCPELRVCSGRVLIESLDKAREIVRPVDWDDGDPAITRADAAFLLGTAAPNIYGLIGDKLLPEDLKLSDVQSFASKFLLTRHVVREVALRGGTSDCRLLVQELHGHGIHPFRQVTYKNRHIWYRSDILAYLSMKDSAQSCRST